MTDDAAYLHVVAAGPQCTIQDGGRPGFRRFGVSEGGALDDVAMADGAALLDNPADAAAIEMAMVGVTVVASVDCRIALTGASMTATIAGTQVAWSAAHFLPAETELQIGATSTGVYGYLHVAGGIATPPVLGSRSTHLGASIGGIDGSPLRPGDRLPLTPAAAEPGPVDRRIHRPTTSGPIRVLWAPQADLFPQRTRDRLTTDAFTMTGHRDRMGARLDPGAPLDVGPRAATVLSSPVVLGDIQVPGDGLPVVLLADRQPTGGYPRLATVISADVHRLVQTRPGDPVNFSVVLLPDAVAELARHRNDPATVADHIVPLTTTPNPGRLASENLISGVVAWDHQQ